MNDQKSGRRIDANVFRRGNEECIQEDIARYVGAPPELHERDLEAVCRVVAETLRNRPDAQDALDYQDRVSILVDAFWRRKRALAARSTALV